MKYITETEIKNAVNQLPYCINKDQLHNHIMFFIKQDKANRKTQNIKNSVAKAKAKNPNFRTGRKKIRNDEQIKELKAKGLSYRAIAKEIGLSTTAVQRALNGKK